MGAAASVMGYRTYIRENFILWKEALSVKPYLPEIFEGGRSARASYSDPRRIGMGFHAVSCEGKTDVYDLETGQHLCGYSYL